MTKDIGQKVVQVINKSALDDIIVNNEIKIEVRIQNMYILSNYFHNIQHLPGIIEMDVLDSFRILCRRLERAQ